VDTVENAYIGFKERELLKEKYGISEEKIIVFIGSWHKPNLEAVEEILTMAKELTDCKFIIMGGLNGAFTDRTIPGNVVFTGSVSNEMKRMIFSVADIAINPMLHGSGTNLKIAEYISFGIPVITTDVGARGYHFNEKCVYISDVKNFGKSIIDLLAAPDKRKEMAEQARRFIEENFDWDKISEKMTESLTRLYVEK
jgi:glycosyltransferase involved in cell wall biosynthesis